MPLYIIVLWLEHIQNLIFFINFQSNVHTFFDASFWDPFFEFLVRLGAKKIDFGSPLAPSWAPNGAKIGQRASKIANTVPKWLTIGIGNAPFFAAFLNVLNPQNYYV